MTACTDGTCGNARVGWPRTADQCYACWKRLNLPQPKATPQPKAPPQTPSLARRAVNLLTALPAIVASGARQASPEMKAYRLAVCESCPLKVPNKLVCSDPSCGCFLGIKAGLEAMHCPQGKW